MVRLKYIAPEEVSTWWPRLKLLAENIADHMRGKYTAEDLFSSACLSKIQLWICWDVETDDIKGLGITQVNDFPSTRVCQAIAMTGKEMKSWVHWMPEVERWAKFNKCTDMELIARPGWERVMKKQGFVKTHVVLNKSLK